jgi:hypothetical protein
MCGCNLGPPGRETHSKQDLLRRHQPNRPAIRPYSIWSHSTFLLFRTQPNPYTSSRNDAAAAAGTGADGGARHYLKNSL